MAGWKWYCLFYEFTLSIELLITAYYWALEYPARDPNQSAIADLHSNFVHTFPLAFLLFDFCFLSAMPFLIRHELFNMIIKLAYMAVNLTLTLTDKPVYGLITWRSGLGIGLPLALIVAMAVLHVILHLITICKLKCLRHKDMVDLLTDECECQAQVDSDSDDQETATKLPLPEIIDIKNSSGSDEIEIGVKMSMPSSMAKEEPEMEAENNNID